MPWLDASAVLTDSGEIALAVVNRHPTEAIEACVAVTGADGLAVTDVRVLCGQSECATTGEHLPDAVSVSSERADAGGPPLTHRFPAHSATVITFAREIRSQELERR